MHINSLVPGNDIDHDHHHDFNDDHNHDFNDDIDLMMMMIMMQSHFAEINGFARATALTLSSSPRTFVLWYSPI